MLGSTRETAFVRDKGIFIAYAHIHGHSTVQYVSQYDCIDTK